MGTIALLGCADPTAAYLRRLPELATEPVTDFADLRLLLDYVQRPDHVDLVVLGTLLADPIRVAQRVSAADTDVAILILAKRDHEERLRNVLRFTPFINADLQVVAVESLAVLDPVVVEAAERTRRRRSHRATILALSSRLAEAAPREPRATVYLERLLDYVPVAVVTVGPRGVVESWNRYAAKIFAISERDAVGRPLADFFPEPARRAIDACIESTRQALAPARPCVVERATTGGDAQFLDLVVTSLEGVADQGAHLLLFQDVTERTRGERERATLLTQERAARAEAEAAVRARDEFLSVAAHELKTPLTSLRASAQLLLRRIGQGQSVESDTLRPRLLLIEKQTRKLGNLVNQLLDITRVEAGRLRLERAEVDVGHLVEDVVNTAREQTDRHSISLRVQEPLTANADPLRLEQVLANLLDNAIKYSPAGRPIEVDVREVPPGQIEIAVTDHGVGVPVEYRTHLFERFFRVPSSDHLEGLGLGLHISRQIVELHGGTLTVEFPEAGGTRGIVRLPTGKVS